MSRLSADQTGLWSKVSVDSSLEIINDIPAGFPLGAAVGVAIADGYYEMQLEEQQGEIIAGTTLCNHAVSAPLCEICVGPRGVIYAPIRSIWVCVRVLWSIR